MKILFFGDIVGKIGRQALKRELPKLKKKYKPDLILANAENLAHGSGITEKTIQEMRQAGIGFFTTGNHILDNEQGLKYLKEKEAPVVIPANFQEECPGKIYQIITVKNKKILLINLLGQIFIDEKTDSPFKTVDAIIEETKKEKPDIIIIDLHAEATSEKQALWHYLDGRVGAILGTHTHVGTVNPRISKNGTALVEDVGMVGASDSILGAKKENILKRFLTSEKAAFEPTEKGPVIINAVLLSINKKDGKTKTIERIDLLTE